MADHDDHDDALDTELAPISEAWSSDDDDDPSDATLFEWWVNERLPELERLRAAGHLEAVDELLEAAIDAQREVAHHADRLARIRDGDQGDWVHAEREYRLEAIAARLPMIEYLGQLLTEIQQHPKVSITQLLSPSLARLGGVGRAKQRRRRTAKVEAFVARFVRDVRARHTRPMPDRQLSRLIRRKFPKVKVSDSTVRRILSRLK